MFSHELWLYNTFLICWNVFTFNLLCNILLSAVILLQQVSEVRQAEWVIYTYHMTQFARLAWNQYVYVLYKSFDKPYHVLRIIFQDLLSGLDTLRRKRNYVVLRRELHCQMLDRTWKKFCTVISPTKRLLERPLTSTIRRQVQNGSSRRSTGWLTYLTDIS